MHRIRLADYESPVELYGSAYDQAPWTDDGRDSVSLETHEDGVTPWYPTPGDSGLSGALFVEVENFTVVAAPGQPAAAAPPFVVTEWGRDHYYGATFENTFAHSKALLHSTNQSIGSAKGSMVIPTSATYYVCVRCVLRGTPRLAGVGSMFSIGQLH